MLIDLCDVGVVIIEIAVVLLRWLHHTLCNSHQIDYNLLFTLSIIFSKFLINFETNNFVVQFSMYKILIAIFSLSLVLMVSYDGVYIILIVG